MSDLDSERGPAKARSGDEAPWVGARVGPRVAPRVEMAAMKGPDGGREGGEGRRR